MLLKNNTSSRAAWLYLLAAPLAAGMIVLSGWSASAQNPERGQKDDMKDRISKEMVKTGFTKTSDTTWTKDGVNVALVENPNPETIATELKQAEENKLAIEAAKKTGISQDIPQDADKKVKTYDEMPEFQGSRTTGFPKWVESQLRFPEEAVKKGLTGGVVKVKFVVNKQGKVQDVSLYKGIDPLLDNIVMKVVASSPDWKPGKYKGKPVDVPLMLPFMFDLETSDAKTGAESHVGEIGQTFLIVEEMPTFQGGKINDFRNWVQDNIKYPAEAKAAKKQGTVYVSFVIDTLGNPVNINLVRGADPALEAEAIRVIKSSPAWQPGKQRSRKVNVSFSIPIAFILSENGEMIKPPATQQKPPVKAEYNGQHVFLIVEDMPTFQGGKIEDFRNWVQTNVKYPELAKEKRLSGTEYVTFIVDTTGRVVNPQVIRSVDPILDAEILRVLCSAPLWQPGKQRGQLVNVSFAIPVKFVLEGPAGEPAQKDTSRTVMQVASTVQGVASRQEVIRGGNTVYVDGIRVKASDKQVFMIVEKMPKFKGGDIKKFVKWAQSNVKYPALAMENSISGTVEVYFIVNKVGQVEDVTVEKSIDPALDEAAINVVKSSPAWTPGQQRGKNVNVSFKIPIKFKLQ